MIQLALSQILAQQYPGEKDFTESDALPIGYQALKEMCDFP